MVDGDGNIILWGRSPPSFSPPPTINVEKGIYTAKHAHPTTLLFFHSPSSVTRSSVLFTFSLHRPATIKVSRRVPIFFFLKKKSCPNQPMGAMALARGAMLPPALVRCGAARPFCRFERRLDQVVESQCLFFLLLSFSLAQVNSVAAARAWRFE